MQQSIFESMDAGTDARRALAGLVGDSRAAALIERFGTLRRMALSSVHEMAEVPGVGLESARRVVAALACSAYMVRESAPERPRVRCAADVYAIMRPVMVNLPHEEFHVLLLSTLNDVLRDVLVTRGTLDASLVHPREVFRPAILEAAASLILVHNHPSGDPSPSAEDRAVTSQLRIAGGVVGIEVLDHVIIGERSYTSFAESGLLQ